MIKSFAVFFTASNLFGGKSVASIDELISITKTISITSILVSFNESIIRGLDKAIIIRNSHVIAIEDSKGTDVMLKRASNLLKKFPNKTVFYSNFF